MGHLVCLFSRKYWESTEVLKVQRRLWVNLKPCDFHIKQNKILWILLLKREIVEELFLVLLILLLKHLIATVKQWSVFLGLMVHIQAILCNCSPEVAWTLSMKEITRIFSCAGISYSLHLWRGFLFSGSMSFCSQGTACRGLE